jgi:hypothetical protein
MCKYLKTHVFISLKCNTSAKDFSSVQGIFNAMNTRVHLYLQTQSRSRLPDMATVAAYLPAKFHHAFSYKIPSKCEKGFQLKGTKQRGADTDGRTLCVTHTHTEHLGGSLLAVGRANNGFGMQYSEK